MSEPRDEVDVIPVGAAQWPLIEGLFQFYVYDFSEMEPVQSAEFDVDPRGRFGDYPYIDSDWSEPARIPLVIRWRGRPAGFALLNDHSHSGLTADHNMAEFFVMRKYRRQGVASAAVRQILVRYPGLWEAAVAARNTAARAFWPRAVTATPGVRDLTILEGDGVRWTGPILRFTVDP